MNVVVPDHGLYRVRGLGYQPVVDPEVALVVRPLAEPAAEVVVVAEEPVVVVEVPAS